MSDSPHTGLWKRSATIGRLLEALRRRERPAPLIALIASFVLAACLGLMLYAATSLTFLASEPMADPHFGPQNACALKALKDGRTGFAVGADGSVAVYSGTSVVLCGFGHAPSPRQFELTGVTAAAFDFSGTLFVARRAEKDSELLALSAGDSGFKSVGELKPIALVGHKNGVVALEASGRLVSVTKGGDVLAVTQLPDAPTPPSTLAANEDGTLVSLMTAGGLFVLDAQSLKTLRAESPCDVEWAWWLFEGDALLLSCGPHGRFSLRLNARTGEREEARLPAVRPSTLVPGPTRTYVEDCGALPCSTRGPG